MVASTPSSAFSAAHPPSNPALDEFSLAGVTPEDINQKQIFRLIKTLIPLEVCQYHQILPLSVEGKYLKLGMTDLDDDEALNFVRRTLGYIHCTLLPRPISVELLQAQLAHYQQHLQNDSQGARGPIGPLSGGWSRPKSGQEQGLRGTTAKGEQGGTAAIGSGAFPNSTTPLSTPSGPSSAPLTPNLSATANAALGAKIRSKLGQSLYSETLNSTAEPSVENAENGAQNLAVDPLGAAAAAPVSPAAATHASCRQVAAAYSSTLGSGLESGLESALATEANPADRPAMTPQDPLATDSIATPSPNAAPQAPPPPPLHLVQPYSPPRIPPLKLQTYYLTQPLEALTDLPAHNLLQELLGRVLLGGIGRLYFEPATTFGKILWSQSGVLQSVLDPVDLPLYRGMIEELKILAGLPPQPLRQTQHIELERLYQDKRLLLRIHIMPRAQGEQATLQVLRGAALKFYEQQQISKLENDALLIAQQLHRKLSELRSTQDALQGDRDPSLESLGAITELKEMLNTINQRLQNL